MSKGLLERVREMLQELGKGWHEYLMRTQELNILAPDLAAELSKARPVRRNIAGFEDFAGDAKDFARGVEPGDPARSLLYHALASPDVRPTDDKDKDNKDKPYPDLKYPTWAQLDVLEDYIYSLLGPMSEADWKNTVIGVFAYEYRPKQGTTHRRHADMVFSRTGIARIGTSEAVYNGPERAYTPATGKPGKIGVLPARYGVFLAKEVKGRKDNKPNSPLHVSMLGFSQEGDENRTFFLPFRKLFSGAECIAGKQLAVTFAESHRAEKLRRIIERVREIDPKCLPPEFNMNEAPILRQSPDPDLVRMTSIGSSVLISAPPKDRLVSRAVQKVKGRAKPKLVRFRVPSENLMGELLRRAFPVQGAGVNRHYSALQLVANPIREGLRSPFANSQSRQPRNWPMFVYIREEILENGQIVDLNELDVEKFHKRINDGGYWATMFEDHTCDGCVMAYVDGLARNVKTYPAFSAVAALSFFPRSLELDLEKWTDAHKDTFHQGDSHPLCEGRYYANPHIKIPDRNGKPTNDAAFDNTCTTVTAVVGRQLGTKDAPPDAANLRKVFRTSFLADAASNVFFPGWDVTIANSNGDFGNHEYFYVTYGLGSPFPEDVKFCSAANGFWPTASPDAGRMFHRTDSPTSIMLLDDELGLHPRHPHANGRTDLHGWDGSYGPFFDMVAGKPGVNFSNLERVDYIRDALEGRFGKMLLDQLSSDVLIERLDCHRRSVEELQKKYFKLRKSMGVVSKTNFWLINAIRVENWKKAAPKDPLTKPGYRLVYALSTDKGTENLKGDDKKYTRRWQPIQDKIYVADVAPGEKPHVAAYGAVAFITAMNRMLPK